MVGAAGAVFARRAPKLRHRHQRHVARIVAQIAPEGGNRRGEIAKAIRKLPVHAALVHVRVPSAYIGEGHLNAKIGLQQLGNLLHVVAELCAGIVRGRVGRVLRGIGCAQHLYCVKCLVSGGVEDVVPTVGIHRFKCACRRRQGRSAARHRESVHVAQRDRRNLTG